MDSLFPFPKILFPCGLALVASFAAFAADNDGQPKTFREFAKSAVAGAEAPAGLSAPLRALWHAKAGQWDKAHDICQNIQTETGSWIHALLHREEGDRSNAKYWYLRAGKTMPEGVSIDEEWSVIAREVWHGERGIAPGEEAFTSRTGLVATSAAPAGGEEGTWNTEIRKDGKLVLTIPKARPVAFSPSGDILLLIEAAPDDDCRHFLVKPRPDAKIPPFGQRKRIGGRHVTGHAWADDGRSLKLTTPQEHGGPHEETITIADHLSCAPAKPKP